jgi:hypothetical protein
VNFCVAWFGCMHSVECLPGVISRWTSVSSEFYHCLVTILGTGHGTATFHSAYGSFGVFSIACCRYSFGDDRTSHGTPARLISISSSLPQTGYWRCQSRCLQAHETRGSAIGSLISLL